MNLNHKTQYLSKNSDDYKTNIKILSSKYILIFLKYKLQYISKMLITF